MIINLKKKVKELKSYVTTAKSEYIAILSILAATMLAGMGGLLLWEMLLRA